MADSNDLKLLSESLEEAGQYIERLKTNKKLVVEPLFQGDYSSALKQLIDLIEGLGWLNQVLTSAKDLMGLLDSGLDEQVAGFNDYLRQVSEALEKEDFVLMGDLIEYSLDENLNRYSVIFKTIGDSVGGEAGLKS